MQNLKNGQTTIADVPIPIPRPGCAQVRTAVSLVSAGTERMLVEFAEKSLVGKARSRPDLMRQVLDKARREGVLTTLESAFNRLDQPMPLGYSSAGTITAVGEGLQGLRVGDRVACAGGGYAVHAEYGVAPQNLLTPLPDCVDFEAGAFTTLGAIAMHGFRLAQPQLGEQVGVIGLGLLGLLAVGIALAAGCQVFGIDLEPRRVALAAQMGATAVLRPQAEQTALAFTHGRGLDAILICADTPTSDPVELAGVIARDRARVVAVGAVGLSLPRKIYYEKELSFINSRSYGPGRYDPAYEEQGQDYPIGYVRWTEGRNMQAFVELLANRRLDVAPLITHRFPIEQAASAYELITGKVTEPFLGVLLTYPQPVNEPALITQTAEPIKIRPGGTEKPLSVRLGVLGAGNFAGAVMFPTLQKIPQIERVAIASASGLHAHSAAQKYGFDSAAADEAQLLRDPSINTIAILTRHDLHSGQVVRALQAGKHVFCEKPLAVNSQQLEEIRLQVELSPQCLLMVGFNRRFAPLAVRLAEFLKDRQEPLVAHYRVNAGFLPLTHWLHDPNQGGGRIIGEGCHFIDFLSFLAGNPPLSVSAQALPDLARYREDNAVLTFTFPDGSLGTVTYLANGDKAFPKERLEVFCAGKVAVLDDFRSLELVQSSKRTLFRSHLRQDKGHRAEWEAFAASILAVGAPPIPYAQLFGVTRATFAAVEALQIGEMVSLP
jgi:predicted dehydrogenase/threonine dehydrogenase-like Zn-dependent dehydrogenase